MHDGSFVLELVRGVPVVSAPEKVDITNNLELRSALLEAAAIASGSVTVVADMTRTWFCDLCGVDSLLAAHEHARAEGGELLLVASSPLPPIFAMTGVDRVISFFTSLDDALAHTSAGDGSPLIAARCRPSARSRSPRGPAARRRTWRRPPPPPAPV